MRVTFYLKEEIVGPPYHTVESFFTVSVSGYLETLLCLVIFSRQAWLIAAGSCKDGRTDGHTD